MGAVLGRKRAGDSRPRDPEMGEEKLEHFARKPGRKKRKGMRGEDAADALASYRRGR
jgi:hypothetical protein